MCVCVCLRTYVHVCVCAPVCLCMCACACVRSRMRVRACMCVRACVRAWPLNDAHDAVTYLLTLRQLLHTERLEHRQELWAVCAEEVQPASQRLTSDHIPQMSQPSRLEHLDQTSVRLRLGCLRISDCLRCRLLSGFKV